MSKGILLRKWVSAGLAAALLAMGGSAAFGVTAGELPLPEPTFAEKQDQAVRAYANLLDSFGYAPNRVYPASYAGAYLNSDGQLVVKSTSTSLGAKQSFRMASQNPNILVEQAEYSYSELKDIQDTIFEYMEAHPVEGRLPIRRCGIANRANRINVYLSELTEENIAMVRAVADSPAMRFYQIEECVSQSADTVDARQPSKLTKWSYFHNASDFNISRSMVTQLYSGSEIRTQTTSNTITGMSVGYRAKKQITATTYEYGFVTAGHGTKGNGNVYNTSLENIGTVTSRLFNAMADVAFVKMNSNVTVFNMIANQTGTVNSGYMTPMEDAIIYKSGFAGGVSGGKVVLETCDDYAPLDVNVRDVMISFNNGVVPGDSGGIVYCRNANGTNTIVGIVSGTYYGSYMATVKASNIAYYAAVTTNY